MPGFDYSTYLSPFTWRYGSEDLRHIWSETNKRKIWRQIWVALARAQSKEELVSKEELDDLIAHQNDIDIDASHKIEAEIHHDLMAEIKVFASQAKIGGGKIHLGATAMDIEDNADAIRIKESLQIIEKKLKKLILIFAKKINDHKDTVCMAYTHLQPAEPTTLGYRFAFYAQDLLLDKKLLEFAKTELKGKGLKGAVGTSASYSSLLHSTGVQKMENEVMKQLGIDAVEIASQTAPRKLEFFVASALSSIAQSLYKFAFDVRLMQSPGIGEWQEPFGTKQVGSSAMPFKKNPIKSEQICSLSRLVFHLADISRDNASHMLLERTLDDSANRRIYIPEMFLAVDSILESATKIIDGLVINDKRIEKNLETYGPFAATEAIMMESVKKGANRQDMHEVIRELSMKAWKEIQENDTNPLTQFIIRDKRIMNFLSTDTVKKLLDVKTHIGLASQSCAKIIKELKNHE
ncbi:MAG: adenylosuccinate lyase [Candidatus Levyibacteriota bacterium]|nr:MAG: adenylosuccinate lyase [Candidatus Levybacteria bacterium]